MSSETGGEFIWVKDSEAMRDAFVKGSPITA